MNCFNRIARRTDGQLVGVGAIGSMTAIRSGVFLAAVVALTGCGGNPNRGNVAGTVTVDGQPAESGAISFAPVDGKSPTTGGPIEAGRYAVEVPFGTSKVAIRVPKVVGQRKLYDTPDSPVQPIMEERLPAKYNDATELTIDVKPGDNPHDFDLKTK